MAKAKWKLFSFHHAPSAVVAAARCDYRDVCCHRWRTFVWNLGTFQVSHEWDFWALLCVLPPPPVPSVEDFLEHFASVFGAFWSGELDPGLQHQLLSTAISPFTVAEVVTALDMMAHHHTSGIAAFPVDFYHAA